MYNLWNEHFKNFVNFEDVWLKDKIQVHNKYFGCQVLRCYFLKHLLYFVLMFSDTPRFISYISYLTRHDYQYVKKIGRLNELY